jgi:hypothetical protein
VHVLPQRVEPRQALLIAKRIHRLRHTSCLKPRGAAGISGGETTTTRGLRGHFQVQAELLFQVAVASAREPGSREAVNPFAKNAHPVALSQISPCSSVWMMVAIRAHARRSLAS